MKTSYENRNEKTKYKKSLSARTTGKVKRALDGLKIQKKLHTKKFIKKTTFSFWDLFK